jgi:MFS family permease
MVSRARVLFSLTVLTLINTLNFFDRQILPAVQEKVRQEWSLSDSQLGWLGTAFILLYAVVGLPLGRWTDTGPRRGILALGVGLWSLLTALSAWAWDFWSLFLLRLGVGVGEASCAPAASSLIGDLVPAERRARALGFFMLGLPLGLALSYLVSSTIADRVSWRAAFLVAGLPGLLLAGLALTVSDPREARDASSTAPARPPVASENFAQAVAVILRQPTMIWISLSGAIHNFNMYALGSFLASLLRRYHHLSVESAGHVTALVFGFGALGLFTSGWLGDWAFRRWSNGRLHVAWVSIALAIPCLLLALQAPPGAIGLCASWLLVGYFLLYGYYGTVYAAIQDIIEPSLRGTAMALYFFAMYFLGAVLGPVGLGWLSDGLARHIASRDAAVAVAEWHAAQGLHDALYIVPAFSVLLVGVLFAATRTFPADYRKRQQRQQAARAAAGTDG